MTFAPQAKNIERVGRGGWLALPFLALLVVNTAHHQPWSDELHAWAIALNSPNLAALFANLRYEGHPGLWHVMLWLGSRMYADPVVMILAHFVPAALCIVVIAKWAPFGLAERALLLANYFLVYEYAVIARNYGLGLLLGLLYAMSRTSSVPRLFTIALILGAMGTRTSMPSSCRACSRWNTVGESGSGPIARLWRNCWPPARCTARSCWLRWPQSCRRRISRP